jgi:hypothetical protein
MRKHHWARAEVAAIGVVLSLVLSPTPAGASGTAWTLMPRPANDGVNLAAVSCRSTSYCLAVGDIPNQTTGVSRPAAEFWNGTAWKALTAPSNATEIRGVSCPPTSYCIAVGYQDTTTVYPFNTAARAWSWNGTKWSSLSPINPASTANALQSVKCGGTSSNCEVVGYHGGYYTSGNYFSYPLAEYWNGTKWANQSTKGAPQGELSGVSCITASGCEAVGSTAGGNALAMRWNGTSWASQNMPALSYGGTLSGISCYSGGCTAVGSASGSSNFDTLAEVWNGASWKLQSPLGSGNGDPNATPDNQWLAVHCTSASSCLAVGSTYDDDDQGGEYYISLPLADTWNGKTWTVNSTPSAGLNSNGYPWDVLNGLACTSTACASVGGQQNSNDNWASLAMRN